MLSFDVWANILLVCTALLALFALLRQVWKGVRYVFRGIKKWSELADQLLGDEENPSLMKVLEDTRATGQATLARVEAVEEGLQQVIAAQADHLEQWHGADAKAAGPVPVPFQLKRR